MFVNTELLEFIRLKNPLSSVIGKHEVITNACCKCPFCHSKTNSLNLFHDEIYTCFHVITDNARRFLCPKHGGAKEAYCKAGNCKL